MNSNQRRPKLDGGPSSSFGGILDEQILILVFNRLKWDIHALVNVSRVNRRLGALAKRILWRELCFHRAPRLASTLVGGGSSRIAGGWDALAKLLFFCGGCSYPARYFRTARAYPGHFVSSTRFSKTSGRSFLAKSCRGDVLYVTDPCEHQSSTTEQRAEDRGVYDVGVYRGVFRGFTKSRTRECLIGRRVGFAEGVRCPYCGARVWSMTEAKMVPRKSVARRLGSSDGRALEYFVCLNGHLHGTCLLLHLSSSDDDDDDDDDEDEDHYNDENNHI